jgi:hypothetical protein
MLEIDIIQGSQLTQIQAESIKLRIVGEGTAKILTGHMPFIALCEGNSLDINGVIVPITNQFLVETNLIDKHTSVTIFAPEIPGIPPLLKCIP